MNKQDLYLAAVATDLKVFMLQCFGTIYPGKEFLDSWHIDAIIYCLEQSIRGEMPRLIINVPPRHLKSFIISVVLPAWILAKDPTAKIICISYSDDLAKTLARDFRRIVESEWYKKLFPEVVLSKATENELVTTLGGFRFATSVGGTLTGRGGDFILVDDPIKPEDAYSEKIRNDTNEWFGSTLLSRLDDKRLSVLILVMQRLHVSDLTGYIEGSGAFHKLSLPAISTRKTSIRINANEVYVRPEDEALHGERESLETLQRIRDEMGDFNFAAQYQQRPEIPEGAMFKRKWINFTARMPNRTSEGILIVSIDTAQSTSETADYSAITVIYSTKDAHYVLCAERGRWDYETLLHNVLSIEKRYNHEVTYLIEYASSGISLVNTLLKARKSVFWDTETQMGKQTRASYVLPIIHRGRLFIVNQEGKNHWVEPFVTEIVSFPHCRFDDQVDSLVQALYWAERRVNPSGNYLPAAA